jgi:outer membrane protein OmpA-like peptidoglycan-associated protein
MLLVVAASASACAGTETREKLTLTRATIKAARDNGAYTCAPRELAMAESHAVFADQELSEGDLYRANDELAVADDNARDALAKSPPGKCGGKAPVVAELDTDHDGIPDSVDKCPLIPEDKDGFQDADGCPDLDNDGDGIPDVDDKCPNEPEDMDGFQDADGCPDPDNDGDGIPDTLDKCPNEYAPHTEDGCPKKYQLVEVTQNKILIKQTIFFDFNKASIKPISYAVLVEVAQALNDHPNIKIRVEGHTDSRGNAEYNRKLSQNRAESVRNFLIGQGIGPERMEAMGYGSTQPIADNRTEEGRTQNRRVEFIIVSQ